MALLTPTRFENLTPFIAGRKRLQFFFIACVGVTVFLITHCQPKVKYTRNWLAGDIVATLVKDINTNAKRVTRAGCLKINLEKKKRIVIIGAGPTGLGVAYRLYELGVLRSKTQVVILEQTSGPGGLASSFRDKHGFLWDNGGHVVFSHYPYYDRVLDKAVSEWEHHIRAAYVYMLGSSGKRKFIPYPVQNNIHLFDKEEQEKALTGLEEIVGHPKYENASNFDEWLVNNFGEGLCEVFMRKYNRKVWTVDPREMNSLWMGERVAVPNIEKIKDKISREKIGLKNEAKDTNWGPNNFFRYPRYGGTGAIWKGIARLLPQGWFHYNKTVRRVVPNKKRIYVQDSNNPKIGHVFKYDYLISTTPLDRLFQHISGFPTNSFVYSRTHIVGIGLRGHPPDFLANKSWIYFPDSDSPFYRVTVLSNYADDMVPMPGKHWSLMCEVAQPMSENVSYPKDNIIERTLTSLMNYGFIEKENVISKYYRYLDHGYPVPFLKREKVLRSIQPWLESRAIYSRGRFGGWRYEVGNQDHSFMQGVEVADLIMLGIPEETYPKPNHVNSFLASDRTVNCTPPLPLAPKYEFVVAHYNEGLRWMKPYADHCHVYDKNEAATTMQVDFYQWEHLPNVGREGHTHLYHIIENYHHLADVTVFLQGSMVGHRNCTYRNVMQYVKETKEKGFSVHHYSNLTHWEAIELTSKWKVMQDKGSLRSANQSLGEFWEIIFGSPHPNITLTSRCGCFGVSRKRIKTHPKEFYEKLIQYVNNHNNPEEGHYLERLWVAIFEKPLEA